MRISIFTNTFLPHVGGVAGSVRTFLEDYRRRRHRVLIVAPEFAEGAAPRHIERAVERVPAWKSFNGSEFSVSLPLGPGLSQRLEQFRPDIMHAQHPFLLGDSARLRLGALHGVPVVFTHHTLYEQYTHYVPFDSAPLQAFVIELATRFANCCQGVIAPSNSLASILKERGVTAPIKVVPTGIDTDAFAAASRSRWRRRLKLPEDAIVLGHVGRLATEKNLPFWPRRWRVHSRQRLKLTFSSWAMVPPDSGLEDVFTRAGVSERVHFAGKLSGQALRDAYAAMNLFVFSSHSETQGMVLTEAMATGCPVIALDASGVRDVLRDQENGRLLPEDASEEAMAAAIDDAVRQPGLRDGWRQGALLTARSFDRKVTADQALDFYHEIKAAHPGHARADLDDFENWWKQVRDRLAIEGRLISDKVAAATHAITGTPATPEPLPASG